MEKYKKRWGDRRDARWLRDIPAMNQIMPTLMPNRADNEAYINLDIDLRPLDAYLAKKNEGLDKSHRYTYFHVISAAIAKAFVLRPRMNRFICNNKVFQRDELTLAFVVKKQFSDKSEEGLAYIKFQPDSTIDTFHDDLMRIVHAVRKEGGGDTSSDAMNILVKLPHCVTTAVVNGIKLLDRHGLAPDALIGSDPYHASIMLTNLGSIGLEGGYHHLANWGTNSCFVVVGKKHMKKLYDKQGNEDICEVIPLGITLDERIADGYYYSGTVALVKELLAHPELLEMPANTEVEYAIQR